MTRENPGQSNLGFCTISNSKNVIQNKYFNPLDFFVLLFSFSTDWLVLLIVGFLLWKISASAVQGCDSEGWWGWGSGSCLCAPEGGSRPWLLMKTDWESQQCKSVQQCQVKCPEHSSPEAALEINPPLQHTLCTNSFFLGVFLCVCELFGFAWYRQHSSHHFKTTYI